MSATQVRGSKLQNFSRFSTRFHAAFKTGDGDPCQHLLHGAPSRRCHPSKGEAMKTIALAGFGLALPGMALAQSATFEINGFPVSLHQAEIMALPSLHEQSAPVVLWRDGFAASPVQMLVLGPRGVKQPEDTAAREEIGRLLLTPAASGR
jgi:hypothetical protein